MGRQKFDGGCDPGYTHLGFSYVDAQSETVLMMNVDLRHWDGVKHKLEFQDLGPCIHEFCEGNRNFFAKTHRLTIELLPKVVRIGKTTKRTNPLVRDVMVLVAQTIYILFPHITVQFVDTKLLKSFSGTGHGGSHAENKRLTFDKGTILPRGNMEMAKETFRDAEGIHADPVEATECAMYARDNSHRTVTSQYHKPGVIRKFKTVMFTSPVVYPAKKTAKRAAAADAKAPAPKRKRTDKACAA